LCALVDHDGQRFKLDAAGNAKAAEMVRSAGKKRHQPVVVMGSKTGDVITVDSIKEVR
jgi:hypothetical protein